MWYLIVSIPDLCTLTYFNERAVKSTLDKQEMDGWMNGRMDGWIGGGQIIFSSILAEVLL